MEGRGGEEAREGSGGEEEWTPLLTSITSTLVSVVSKTFDILLNNFAFTRFCLLCCFSKTHECLSTVSKGGTCSTCLPALHGDKNEPNQWRYAVKKP